MTRLLGAVEAGGTKIRCAFGADPDDVRDEARLETREPQETLADVTAFFAPHAGDLSAVGVGCFGPLDLDRDSATYGHVTTTPKPGWRGADVVGALRAALGVPVGLDTDVAASALGEGRHGAARDLDDFVYVTVGTGIGGAVVAGGRVVHGLVHPEIGHLRVPRAQGDSWPGSCPYHGDCLEGLASGAALRARTGRDPASLPSDHQAWTLAAQALAAGLANVVLTTSPRRVIVGGGVMDQPHLLPRVRTELAALLAGYVASPTLAPDALEAYLVAPGLGDRSGLAGGFVLAERALADAAARPAGGDRRPGQ